MTEPSSDDPAGVLRSIWQVGDDDGSDVETLAGNSATCRNLKDVTFEDMVAQGTDLRTAWREQLARDGKLNTSAETIGDIVAGGQ